MSAETKNPSGLYKRCTCPTKPDCRCIWHYKFKLNGPHRGSTHTANKQQALREYKRVWNAILEGKRPTKVKAVSLATLVEQFLTHYEQEHPATYPKAKVVLPGFRDFLHDLMPTINANKVAAFHIDKWKLARTASVERQTVSRELNIIKAMFRQAVAWKYLTESPAAAVTKYKTDDAHIRVLTDEELGQLLTDGQGDAVLLCQVTLECLPRLSEVLGLRREHVGSNYLEIRRKGGKVDRVAVTADLTRHLLTRCHNSGWVFGVDHPGVAHPSRAERRRAARHAAQPTARVLKKTHQPGTPPTQQTATNAVRRELVRLGIEGASHHTMRHTGVTLMLEAGVNPRTIQKLAGWTSLRMLERYGHARDAEAQRAVTHMRDHLAAVKVAAVAAAGAQVANSDTRGAQRGHKRMKTGSKPYSLRHELKPAVATG